MPNSFGRIIPANFTTSIPAHTYGFFGGGYGMDGPSYLNILDYINPLLTTQNAIDSGDLTVARAGLAGVSGSLYGFFGGGDIGGEVYIIDYISFTRITQNALNTGSLSLDRWGLSGVSGLIYGFFSGGLHYSTGNVSNVVDRITLATTTQNATDIGDLTVARMECGGISGSTYGFTCGGLDVSLTDSNVIDKIVLATATQNATDVGDLTVASRGLCQGLSGATYGFIADSSNIIDYITLATATQNATDVGDLTLARDLVTGGFINTTYGFFAGGGSASPPYTVNVIDYIVTATTTQNATDTGDLTVTKCNSGSAM